MVKINAVEAKISCISVLIMVKSKKITGAYTFHNDKHLFHRPFLPSQHPHLSNPSPQGMYAGFVVKKVQITLAT